MEPEPEEVVDGEDDAQNMMKVRPRSLLSHSALPTVAPAGSPIARWR
jgi:hypothetical protein